MTGFSANLTGFAQLHQRLEQLSKQEATKAGQAANRAGATALAKKVRAAAPVSNVAEGAQITRHNKSGTTRVEVHRKIVNHVKVRKDRGDTQTKVYNSVYINAYQAAFVEFGSIHNAPNSFFQKAFQDSQQEIIDAMARILNRQLIKRGA